MGRKNISKDVSSVAPVKDVAAENPPPAEVKPERFLIVGIGASAGGLEAFENFFRHVPGDCKMAFVLVPHLDPDHASILASILQRVTTLPVVEAEDQLPVSPGHVYIIPPNRDMAIFHGALQLTPLEKPRGQRMPIDAFFRSLAEDQGELAAGIIFSGTGSDGTRGLRAIVDAGGLALVQEPSTAKYDGMPTSALQADYATHAMAVEVMPQFLLAGPPRRADNAAQGLDQDENGGKSTELNRILMLLRSATGHDFSQYKKNTVIRRIARRMSQHDINDESVYARYLREHPEELLVLFRELLINVTCFFRDPDAFNVLKQEILSPLLAQKPDDYVFRVWVTGCASGEEAYSIAIMLRELMDETQRTFKVQIYSTDLDDEAISFARAGVYPSNIVADVSPERLQRHFIKVETGYRVKKSIREMVVFAIQNVIKDPPFTRLDLLCCRNLLIYLEPELQKRLILAFHYALKPDGLLFLSPSESIGNQTELFTPLNRKWKLYRATDVTPSSNGLMVSGLPWATVAAARTLDVGAKAAKENNLAELTRGMLLEAYAPASVMTDLKGEILFVYGDTGKYLRPAPGQASLNAIGMARPGLQIELLAAIQSMNQGSGGSAEREALIHNNGEVQKMSVRVRALPDPASGLGFLLISFQDLAPAIPSGAESASHGRKKKAATSVELHKFEELERDLAYTKEKLQATIEDQQAANEELMAANEEMQSTNEELQSTNEELETSKEELQSLNEELLTVNAELQAKIEQLAGVQSDMKNLLDNVGTAVVFLDDQLRIRRFTREAARIYRLVSSDVGRPLADIKSDLEQGDMLGEAKAVLDSLVPCEREVKTIAGVWYLARIQPYRTMDNIIEGVVLTFTDISRPLETGAAIQQARVLAETIINTVREPLIVLNGELQIISASRSFYQVFKVEPKDTVGRRIYDIGNHQWHIPALRTLLQNVLLRDQNFDDYVVEHNFPVLGQQKMVLCARPIAGATREDRLILLAIDSQAAAAA